MKYRITYTANAERVRNTLPRTAQTTLTTLLQRLGNNPRAAGRYDSRDKSYTAGLGKVTVLYSVDGHIVTVKVIQIVWIG